VERRKGDILDRVHLPPIQSFIILFREIHFTVSDDRIKNIKYITTNLLESLILSVSSSSWLVCLLASLILSNFWKPFLDVKGEACQQINKLSKKLQIIHIIAHPQPNCLNNGTYSQKSLIPGSFVKNNYDRNTN